MCRAGAEPVQEVHYRRSCPNRLIHRAVGGPLSSLQVFHIAKHGKNQDT
jgi:hypothetical protein